MDVIYIIERSEAAASMLERVLEQRGVPAFAVVSSVPENDAPVLDIDKDMGRPYRLGALLDRLETMRDQGENPQILRFDTCELDAVYCLFYADDRPDRAGIKLTEKEMEILIYLAGHSKNTPVKRDDLLAAVWGYGDNIETHTLETHIYRLRQKIEDNPAKPAFLVTSDDGYSFPAR